MPYVSPARGCLDKLLGRVSAGVSPEPLKDGVQEQITLAPSLAGLPSAPHHKNSNEGRAEISGGPMMGAGSGCQPERDPLPPATGTGGLRLG